MAEEKDVKENIENKASDKELNFRALEQKLAQEKQARLEAEKSRQEYERKIHEFQRQQQSKEEEEENEEPFVDHKRLEKKLAKFGESASKRTEEMIRIQVSAALEKERMENWIKQNPDFYEVMQHADKLYEKDQELAETILTMPESFNRQKLVYKQIKYMSLHKAPEPEKSIQNKIEQNRKSAYYQPSGMGTAPYGNQGDFSPQGQKNAYEQMQAKKNRLRLG